MWGILTGTSVGLCVALSLCRVVWRAEHDQSSVLFCSINVISLFCVSRHRLRMKSHPIFAGNVAFATVALVALPSYYFCFRRREHQERVIEMMMAVNDFRPGEEMPATVPLDQDHPFLSVDDKLDGGAENEGDLQREFVAHLKERKDWQEPHPTRDAGDVFREVGKG